MLPILVIPLCAILSRHALVSSDEQPAKTRPVGILRAIFNPPPRETKQDRELLDIAATIAQSLYEPPKGDLRLETLHRKNVDLGTIDQPAAQRLLRLIKDPERDIGIARQALIYLAVMMAQDKTIRQLVIDDIVKKPEAYDRDRFDWLTQNIAATHMPNAKQLLLYLAEKINDKDSGNQDMYIFPIYKNIVELVDVRDFDAMIKLVNDEKTTVKLFSALANNLYTVIEQTYRENPEAAAALGDKLATDVNEKKMAGQLLLALARAGSPKGLKMIKKRMAAATNPRNQYGVWTNVKQALSMWSNDSVVPYLVELRTSSHPMISQEADTVLAALLLHDSNRTEAEFSHLVTLVYGDLDTDTSAYEELDKLLSPDSPSRLPENDPRYNDLLARMETIKPAHNKKIIFCKSLANHTAKPYILRHLEKMRMDRDSHVAREAEQSLERVHSNTRKAAGHTH